ncbi:hypothetical protein MBLNU230_g6252t1 [Neophaeotheca triangularis]
MATKQTNPPPTTSLTPPAGPPNTESADTEPTPPENMPDINNLTSDPNEPSAIPTTPEGVTARIRFLESQLRETLTTTTTLRQRINALERETAFLESRVTQYEHSLYGAGTPPTFPSTTTRALHRAQSTQTHGTTPGRGQPIAPYTATTPAIGSNYNTNHPNTPSPPSPEHGNLNPRPRNRSANLLNLTFRLSSPSVYNPHPTNNSPTTPGTPGLPLGSTDFAFTVRADDTLAGVREVLAGRVRREAEELVLWVGDGEQGDGEQGGRIVVGAGEVVRGSGVREGGIVFVGLDGDEGEGVGVGV